MHRDIKPENILLQDGAAVVADFGIALAVQTAGGQRLTQTGLSLGTRTSGSWTATGKTFARSPAMAPTIDCLGSPPMDASCSIRNRTGTYQAFRINTDGSGVEPLTAFASGLITYPQLSRDGLTLLFADSSRAAAEATGPWPASRTQVRPLSRAVVDGIPITPLSSSPDERYIDGNRWDPSLRRRVALAVYDRTQQRAWALDSMAVSQFLGWLPDSRTVFTALRDVSFGLLEVTSNIIQRVSGALAGHPARGSLVVPRDGRKVFYSVEREEANIWMLETVGDRR